MPRGTRWYRRLAEVPGIGYAGDAALRATLVDRDATPETHRLDYDGQRTTTLWWPTPAGGTSASPAQRHAHSVRGEQSSQHVRHHVLAAIELPGEPSDYHFAMQGAADLLWKRRRDEPEHLEFVEWLSWLDVRLVDAHPEAFRVSPDSDDFLAIAAFDRLVDLYEREGALREALAAAEKFARYRPRVDINDLRARVAQLYADHC